MHLVQYLYPMISEEISFWFLFIKIILTLTTLSSRLQVVKKLSLSLLICWNVLIMFCRSRMILLTVHWMSNINPVISSPGVNRIVFKLFVVTNTYLVCFKIFWMFCISWAWAFHQHPDAAVTRSRGNIMQLNGKWKIGMFGNIGKLVYWVEIYL